MAVSESELIMTAAGERRIRVIHLITMLELGGAQVNTVYTYENLNRENFDVWLAAGPGGILTDRVAAREHLAIIPDLLREISPVRDYRGLRQLVDLFKKIKPDIVHTHSSKAGTLGRLASFLAKVPIVIHSVHGFSFSPFQSLPKRGFYTAAEKLTARFTTHFIFVSADDVGIAREKKLLRGDNYSIIRSGFPFGKFRREGLDEAEQRRRFNIAPGDFVCGIIAPFKAQKGLFHLLEIAERVVKSGRAKRRVIFLICGDGELRTPLERGIREKGLEASFRLPGFLHDIENAVFLFDLGVSTALWEGLPQSLVQMRICGKTAVVSFIPGNREVIRDNENGYLVKVEDYDAFAERIVSLVNDDPARERLARCRDDFSAWDADYMVREQEKLYQKLLEQAKRGEHS